jgi:hypothetical protein
LKTSFKAFGKKESKRLDDSGKSYGSGSGSISSKVKKRGSIDSVSIKSIDKFENNDILSKFIENSFRKSSLTTPNSPNRRTTEFILDTAKISEKSEELNTENSIQNLRDLDILKNKDGPIPLS